MCPCRICRSLFSATDFVYLGTMTRVQSLVMSFALAALTALVPTHASAQAPIDADHGSSVRTRAELQELLELYERVLESPAYSDAVKESTRVQVRRIRERLERGDFELGDRIVLYVRGEPELPDTVGVQAGPRITLPLFGDISLEGVLRSEVEAHLTEALGQYINNPVVDARALMRVSVQGAVGSPGFYVVPADMLLSETLMVAGGPAQNSQLDDMRIERGAQVVMQGDELQEAVRQGLTLDQLNLQAGDQVVVPQDSGGFWRNLGLVTGLLSTLTIVIFRAF